MRVNACLVLLLLGLVLVQALPTEKSLKNENLKIEEAGEETDRSKKSILCLDTNQGALQPVQTLSMQSAVVPTVQALKIHQAPQSVQALSFQPLQTMNLQPAAQSVQLLNTIQSPQPAQMVNAIQVPQPIQMVNTIQAPQQPPTVVYQQPQSYNVEVAQQPQPYPQTNVNIIQSAPETKPEPTPEVETVVHKEEIVKPEPKPEKVVAKVEKEKVVVPIYKEQVMVKPVMMMPEMQPLSTYVKVPHCHHCQQSVLQCSCRPQSVGALRSSIVTEPHMHLLRHKAHVMGGSMGEPVYSMDD
ncbi:unnamed protein product [Xylocopa violacea]|uniref:Uncharacterized protein n=1 Tax=Xylocopa violacea TaxID=135666 RepID=A0ABP1NQ16_XYLVO